MSWSPPQCPQCSSSSTRFESPIPFGPPGIYGLYWECERCRTRILELCSTGVDEPRPGGCLNCGGPVDAEGHCSACDVDRQVMIDRVHAHCGAPPRLEAIAELGDQGLFRVAFNAVDLLLEQQPDDPATLVAKAKLLGEVRRPAQAVPLLRRALELGGDDPDVRFNLGIALANSGEPDAAIRIYEQLLLITHEPFRRAVMLTNIGGCLSQLGRSAEAETYHRRAVETDPEHLGPRWNLFANLFRTQRYEAALEVVEQTIALPFLERSEVENLQAYRAEILIALRRHRDALTAIDLSLASDPDELNRLATRARILIHLGHREQARACIGKMLGIDPKNALAKYLLERLDRRAAPGSKN